MRNRIRFVAVCVILFAFLLFAKLYSLQIIHAQQFADLADHQYQRPANAFDRGTIYFSDKDGSLISAATLKTGFILAINPTVIQKVNAIDSDYARLAPYLTIGLDEFYAKASLASSTYQELEKRIDDDTGAKIDALNLPGVNLYKDKWRYYPGGDLAAQVLGFMGYKGNVLAGRYGLESEFDSTLARSDGDVYANFFVEAFSNLKKTAENGGPQLEGDVVTTIEPRTQAYLETMIKKVNDQYSSQKTGAIIMNPKTGDIYAMGLYPTFDPNNFSTVSDPAVFQNDLVEGVYEMGSIIKPLTMSAGIDLGKVTASTTYNDKGFVTANGHSVYNFDKKGRGVITLQTAISQSLNTGFAFVVSQIGNKALADYFTSFGFGQKTGVDLPNEGTGLISNLKSPRDLEYITASFGQGIAMTPMEVLRAFSAIANGGMMVTPHVVKQINYRVGISKEPSLSPSVQVMKRSTAEAVTNMMIYNVDNALLHGKAKDPHYSVAAKTGTAQIAENGSYAADRYLHSFVGYLPAHDPKFLVFIYTVNPRGVDYASETLAPPFIDLSKFLINYYQLPPDR